MGMDTARASEAFVGDIGPVRRVVVVGTTVVGVGLGLELELMLVDFGLTGECLTGDEAAGLGWRMFTIAFVVLVVGLNGGIVIVVAVGTDNGGGTLGGGVTAADWDSVSWVALDVIFSVGLPLGTETRTGVRGSRFCVSSMSIGGSSRRARLRFGTGV
jgi:hypothetical protein